MESKVKVVENCLHTTASFLKERSKDKRGMLMHSPSYTSGSSFELIRI